MNEDQEQGGDRSAAGEGRDATFDRFSVVIPTHHRSATVMAQIGRLRSLDGAPEEIVVVDDGSNDDTLDRLLDLEGPDLLVLATAGVGPASARNLGASRATGDWLVFLDDDDEPGPDWMSTWRSLAQEHPGASYLSTGYRVRTGRSKWVVDVEPLGRTFSSVTASYLAGAFAVRTEAFAQVGGFGAGLRFMELTELAARLFDRLAEQPDAFAHTEAATITQVLQPAPRRQSVVPTNQVPSTRRAMIAMAPYLERDRRFHADCLAVLGVAEIRMGEPAAGRRRLVQAAKTCPWRPKHLGRALVASIPRLRRLVWNRGRS